MGVTRGGRAGKGRDGSPRQGPDEQRRYRGSVGLQHPPGPLSSPDRTGGPEAAQQPRWPVHIVVGHSDGSKVRFKGAAAVGVGELGHSPHSAGHKGAEAPF